MDVDRLGHSCAYVAVGSNLDSPENQVLRAIESLDALADCKVIQRSSLYVTEPVGYANQPDFVNAVCSVSTSLSPLELLTELLRIEKRQGRVRVAESNRPRIVDLDLLLYETERFESQRLELPHPRMHKRRFVLEPLAQISPELTIPGRGRVVDLLAQCLEQQVEMLNIQ